MKVIDADGHIAEPEVMFADLPAEFYPRRPLPVFLPTDTERGNFNGCWIIEGKTFPSMSRHGFTIFSLPESEGAKKKDVTTGSQTLADVSARVADLDRLGIDIQVIFPTLFLVVVAEDVGLETALFRAYNTYVGRACAESGGRLCWTALIPFRDAKAAVKEVRRVSDLGASGIFTMGLIWNRNLGEPEFFPVYEEAGAQDLPICVHLGWSSPPVTDLFTDGQSFFNSATVPVIWGFMSTMGAGLLSRFPRLRLGFLETGAAWVPYAIQQIRRRAPIRRDAQRSIVSGIDPEYYRDPEDLFRSGRAFVNCEGDEDFDYLVKHLGEDALMCSSDFPHGDASSEMNFVTNWRGRSDMPDRLKEKLLGGNALKFFRL